MVTKMPAFAALPAALLLVAAAAQPSSREQPRAELERIARELAGGVEQGDWAPWQRHASEDLLYTTELGRTMTKPELRRIFRPLPPPQRRSIAMRVIGSRIRSEAAVLVYELHAMDPEADERYRVTDTYYRASGRWLLVASHVGRVDFTDEHPNGEAGGK